MSETREKLDAAMPSAQTVNNGVDLAAIASFIGRRWRLGMAVLLLTLVGVGAATRLMPQVYRAYCLISIEGAGSGLGGQTSMLGASLLGMRTTSSLSTQATIIRSPVVATATWEGLDAKHQAVLEPGFQVRPLPDTELLEISTWGTDPQATATYADTIAENYLKYRAQQQRDESKSMFDFVTARLEKVRGDLDEAQLAMKQFREENLGFDLTAQASALVSQLTSIESERRATQTQLAARRAELESARSRRVTVEGEEFTATQLTANPVVTSLRQQLLNLKQEQIGVLQVYTPTSPEATRIQARIDRVAAQLEEAATRAIAQELAPLQSGIWVLEAQAAALASAGEAARGTLTQLPEKQYRLAELELRSRTLLRTYEMLADQYQQMRIAQEQEIAGARMVSPAQVPVKPERPDLRVNLALGLAIGFILALATTLLAERLDGRVHTPVQVAEIVDAPVLATIRRGLRSGDAELTNAFRRLRTALMVAQDRRDFRSLLVAGPTAGEGRSFVAANLALEVARSGRNTLLVDADSLDPQLDRQFGVPAEPGLSAVLTAEVPAQAAIHQVPGSNLKLLPWGAARPDAQELLTIERLRALLPALGDSSDLVLLDSAPASLSADVQAIAHRAEATLLVVSLRRSRLPDLRDLVQQLQIAGARIVGVVINRA